MNPVDVLLVFPKLGSFDRIIRDIPLSLIYAATDSVKRGYNVKILDLRLCPDSWQQEIDQIVAGGCRLVGLSVMTGNPIRNSLQVSEYVKTKHNIPVVWGGPHPTIMPEQTLENRWVDYVIRDWGSLPLADLIAYLRGDLQDRGEITGLGYTEDGAAKLTETVSYFEKLDYRDLPYHLVDIRGETYNRLANGEGVMPIFTALGCPYKCTFCMSPAAYEKINGKKWVALEVETCLDHVGYLLERYDFNRIVVYDDDTFVDMKRMVTFLEEWIERGFHKKLRLDFRAMRINELDRMDADYLNLMVGAGVEFMAIGVESGSDRMLRQMKKALKGVDQILRVNKKLADYPTLRPHYNFFCGMPGETKDDLLKTRDLLLQLAADNPYCYLGVGADWKPLPGTAMTTEAVDMHGLILPSNLEEWADIDSFDANKLIHPWYTPEINELIKLLQIAGQLLDRKAEDHHMSFGPVLGKAMYAGILAYRPLLKWRVRNQRTDFLVEYWLRNEVLKRMGGVIQLTNGPQRLSMKLLEGARSAARGVLGGVLGERLIPNSPFKQQGPTKPTGRAGGFPTRMGGASRASAVNDIADVGANNSGNGTGSRPTPGGAPSQGSGRRLPVTGSAG